MARQDGAPKVSELELSKEAAWILSEPYFTAQQREQPMSDEDILRVTNVSVPERLARVDALVALINQAEERSVMEARDASHMKLSLGLTIEPRCIETEDALRLPYPRFTYAVGGKRRGLTVPKTIDVGMLSRGGAAKWGDAKGFMYKREGERAISSVANLSGLNAQRQWAASSPATIMEEEEVRW